MDAASCTNGWFGEAKLQRERFGSMSGLGRKRHTKDKAETETTLQMLDTRPENENAAIQGLTISPPVPRRSLRGNAGESGFERRMPHYT
jgi:hypothetical protein